MAELNGAQLKVEWSGMKTDVVEVSEWTDGSGSLQKMSNIIHAIIHNRTMNHLVTIIKGGWDVNETLNVPDYKRRDRCVNAMPQTSLVQCWVHRTALYEAARRGWTEGVKILLDTGAKCKISDVLENPLALALNDPHCSPELIHLLLKHGADPNSYGHQSEDNPLLQAIQYTVYNGKCTDIVQDLLEHGADPNVARQNKNCFMFEDMLCPLSALWDKMEELHYEYMDFYERRIEISKLAALLSKLLVNFGADVNFNLDRMVPLLHRMVGDYHIWSHIPGNHSMLCQEHLDLFFLHGGNIYTDHDNHGMALEYALTKCGDNNSVRWLIRHGADTLPLNAALLKNNFLLSHSGMDYSGKHYYYTDPALILLQAGMRVPYRVQKQLMDMQMAVSTWLQAESYDELDIRNQVEAIWPGEAERLPRTKCMFPDYLKQQMVDLQEFSDESLNIYPENTVAKEDIRQKWIDTLNQIHSMLEFLGQSHSLQWYCRRCLRENLVCLQPSVVKALPVPARLKRFILCHEI